MKKLFALFAALFVAAPAYAHDDGAHATYLGNEGVMVARGDTKILFDAFYAQSYGQYALVPDKISKAMLNGEAPYDGIDAIFVSHVHGDHFSAAPAIAFMMKNEDVTLYGSQQVYEAMLEGGLNENHPVIKRVIAVDMTPTDGAKSFTIDGLSIDVVFIPHSGGPTRRNIQNLAWRVTLDEETTVMHLGDADPEPEFFLRHKTHFDAKETDTAFPPYWFIGLERGEQILSDIIKAKQSVGIHVPERAAGNGDQWREEAGGDLFTDPGETRDVD